MYGYDYYIIDLSGNFDLVGSVVYTTQSIFTFSKRKCRHIEQYSHSI